MTDKPRHWCFTHFDLEWDISAIDFKTDVRYMIVGREIAPDTKREHWQCYVEFFNPKRMKAAVASLNCPGAHFESRRGTREQARDYCMKEKNFAELGEWDRGGQGKRNDIADLRESIKKGASELELYESHDSMFRVGRSAEKYRLLLQKKQAKEVGYVKREILIFWGPTGTGKTRKALELAGTDYHMVNRSNTGSGSWYDSYDGENTLIFDEFYGDWMKLAELLRLTDGYMVELPTKGGHKILRAQRIIFTSNHDPSTWFPNAGAEKWSAFLRRISSIERFGPVTQKREAEKPAVVPCLLSDLASTLPVPIEQD